jgi:hypothetical protein
MKAAFWFLAHVLSVLVIVVAVILGWQYGWFDPAPYQNVQTIEVERDDENHLLVHLRYEKTEADCEYVRGIAYAVLPGDRIPVLFEPVRHAGETAQRFPGIQHLRWDIDLNVWNPDTVEIWTRHDCGGRRVDRMMAEIEVPK